MNVPQPDIHSCPVEWRLSCFPCGGSWQSEMTKQIDIFASSWKKGKFFVMTVVKVILKCAFCMAWLRKTGTIFIKLKKVTKISNFNLLLKFGFIFSDDVKLDLNIINLKIVKLKLQMLISLISQFSFPYSRCSNRENDNFILWNLRKVTKICTTKHVLSTWSHVIPSYQGKQESLHSTGHEWISG